jgi:hypothetical protein
VAQGAHHRSIRLWFPFDDLRWRIALIRVRPTVVDRIERAQMRVRVHIRHPGDCERSERTAKLARRASAQRE